MLGGLGGMTVVTVQSASRGPVDGMVLLGDRMVVRSAAVCEGRVVSGASGRNAAISRRGLLVKAKTVPEDVHLRIIDKIMRHKCVNGSSGSVALSMGRWLKNI